MATYKHICCFARLRPRKWKAWRRVKGSMQTKKSYLDNAIALRQMKLHLPAPDRWVEILRLYYKIKGVDSGASKYTMRCLDKWLL